MKSIVRNTVLGVLLAIAVILSDAGLARGADDTALRLFNVNSGNTSYVRVPNDPAFSLQTFTLEAWVQRVGIGYGHPDGSGTAILAKPREAACGLNIVSWHMHWMTNGSLNFNLVHTYSSSGVYLTSPPVANPLDRHHLAVTFDGAMIRLFIDGVFSTEAVWNLGTVYYGIEDVLIGADNFGCSYLRRFDGFIDDVRIWNYARTEADIAAYKNCRLTGTETGLVSYWTFDGSDLTDATGHGHHGIANGVAGSLTFAPLVSIPSCAVGVEDAPAILRDAAILSVFPQPTRGRVNVNFELPREGLATLDLYDVTGRKREALTSQIYSAGRHELERFITASEGTGAGLYFLRLQYEGQSVVKRLIIVN